MSRDLRKYARETQKRLLLGALVLLFLVGTGLIYLIYGRGAASMALLCLTIGMIPVLLIFFAFWVLDWIVRRASRE
uniref:Uncharacterized protein n=1 Tax=uncultured Chloroflexota bacterium TaxID=166587 RepID=H5SK82_9CHLR|nr:hypothetical protein [uncultured bacterium]BAL56568.1 hypothetical protein HGMM_F40G09C15 [uncultured Chloroflexota bacterium]